MHIMHINICIHMCASETGRVDFVLVNSKECSGLKLYMHCIYQLSFMFAHISQIEMTQNYQFGERKKHNNNTNIRNYY